MTTTTITISGAPHSVEATPEQIAALDAQRIIYNGRVTECDPEAATFSDSTAFLQAQVEDVREDIVVTSSADTAWRQLYRATPEKINNLVHVLEPPPGDTKEIRTYFEFYRKSTVNPIIFPLVLYTGFEK